MGKPLFWPTFHIYYLPGKSYKNSFRTYMYFAQTIDLFWLTNFEKKKKRYEFIGYGFSLVWFLVLILIRAILEQSTNNKMVSTI